MWVFLKANWGNLASVVGLLFSFLAFVFSKRASIAAREAREAVFIRSFGEDLNNASKAAAEAVAYIRSEKFELAILRTTELINQTSYIITRWSSKLSIDSKNRILQAREQLHATHDLLQRVRTLEPTPKQQVELSRICRTIPVIFIEEYGIAIKAGDES